MSPRFDRFSAERVDYPRALYFEVGSDLFHKQYLNVFIAIGDIILFEIVVFLSRKYLLSLPTLNYWLRRERRTVYWGLIVSNIAEVVLPWRFVSFGGVRDFRAKVNAGIYYNTAFFLVVLVVASLLSEIK